MTKKDYIKSLFILGLPRDEVIRNTSERYPDYELSKIENQAGVCLYELRRQGVIVPRPVSDKPSRHTIIKRCLLREKTNRQILKHLKKVYPEIDDKVHKQRICEYRWFFTHGLLK